MNPITQKTNYSYDNLTTMPPLKVDKKRAIGQVPEELWRNVMTFLHGDEPLKLNQTAKCFRWIAQQPGFWKWMCSLSTQQDPFQQQIETDANSPEEQNELWRVLYAAREMQQLEPWKLINTSGDSIEDQELVAKIKEQSISQMRILIWGVCAFFPDGFAEFFQQELGRINVNGELGTFCGELQQINFTLMAFIRRFLGPHAIREVGNLLYQHRLSIKLLGGRELQLDLQGDLRILNAKHESLRTGCDSIVSIVQLANGRLGGVIKSNSATQWLVPDIEELRRLKDLNTSQSCQADEPSAKRSRH